MVNGLDPRSGTRNHGSMPKKRVIAGVVVLALLGAVLMLLKKPALAPEGPEELTRERAMELLELAPGDCLTEGEPERYRSCEVAVAVDGLRATVTITHDGFFDDSVKASRVEAVLEWREGAWVTASIAATNQCWPGRGHQDFSTELCV